jgi:hypothetical protein
MNAFPDRLPRTVPRREVATGSMGVILAVIAIAAIIIVALSYIYISTQVPREGIGVIGEVTLPDLTPHPTN